MFPVYFIVGLINIFAQRNNYAIQNHPSDMDIRVRRSLPDSGLEPVIHTDTIENQLLDRPKRYAYYRKIKIPVNENQNYGQNNTTNRYDIFNPNYNYLFNRTSSNRTGSYSGPGYNNYRPVIRSYPYGYPPGYEPRTTPSYRSPVNTPDYYNYQNPNGKSFDGYYSYTPRPVNYSPLTDILASYPKNNVNFRGSNSYNNNAYGVPPNNNNSPTPTNNNNYHNLPTAVSPTPSINNNPYGVSPNNNNSPTPNNYNYHNLPTVVSPTPTPSINNYPYGTPPNNNNPPTLNTNNNFNLPTTISPPPNNSPYGSQSNLPTPTSTLPTPTNFNVTSPSSNVTSTTTERVLTSCVICNIRCPSMMKWFGGFCIPDDYE